MKCEACFKYYISSFQFSSALLNNIFERNLHWYDMKNFFFFVEYTFDRTTMEFHYSILSRFKFINVLKTELTNILKCSWHYFYGQLLLTLYVNIFFQSGNRSTHFRPNFRLNFVNCSRTINLFKNIVFLGNMLELSQASKRWAVQKALNLWAGVANLHFREVRQWQGNINIG